MKYKLFTISALVLFWFGCDEREIPLYNTAQYYIEFENPTTDSTIFTFIYYPNDDYYDLAVPVKVAGLAPDRDLTYDMQVGEEFTTATSDQYTLPTDMTFRAERYHDTCYVRLNKTDVLSTEEVRLVLQLVPTEDMGVGKLENAAMVIRFSNMVAQPEWWDDNVKLYYLGIFKK